MNDLVLFRCDLAATSSDTHAALAALAERVRVRLSAQPPAANEVVSLTTCERVEVYACLDARATVCPVGGSAVPSMKQSSGVDVVRHLFRVASGLESRIPGEPHIVGQVRAALHQGMQDRTIGPSLTALFRAAIACSRRARRHSRISADGDSYVARTMRVLRQALGTLAQRHVAVVGTGALGREMARALHADGVARLTLVGRHPAPLATLAREVSGEWMTLHAFQLGHPCDAIVTAVSSAMPILDAKSLAASRPGLVVDLGAPPNVAAQDHSHTVRLVRLSDLGHGARANEAIRQATRVVEDEVERFVRLPEREQSRNGTLRAS